MKRPKANKSTIPSTTTLTRLHVGGFALSKDSRYSAPTWKYFAGDIQKNAPGFYLSVERLQEEKRYCGSVLYLSSGLRDGGFRRSAAASTLNSLLAWMAARVAEFDNFEFDSRIPHHTEL